MKLISLTRGKFTQVDDDMFDYLNKWKWYCNTHNYAVRYDSGGHKTRKKIHMHRLVINAPEGIQVDHIDQDPLNNQRENLRLCTSSQNSRNCHLPKTNTSGYRGIHKCKGKWLTNIRINGTQTYLGSFETSEDAAKAYDKKAREVDGKFAGTNFPE